MEMVEVKDLDFPLIIQEQLATKKLFHLRLLFFNAIITFKKIYTYHLYQNYNKLLGNRFYPKIRIALDEQNSNSRLIHFFAVTARQRRENTKFHVLWRT